MRNITSVYMRDSVAYRIAYGDTARIITVHHATARPPTRFPAR